MNKTKATVCTVAMAAMSAMIVYGLFRLNYTMAASIAVGIMAAIGFGCATGGLHKWLAEEDTKPNRTIMPIALEKHELTDGEDADLDLFLDEVLDSIKTEDKADAE